MGGLQEVTFRNSPLGWPSVQRHVFPPRTLHVQLSPFHCLTLIRMCEYKYIRYETCNHVFIELAGYCRSSLWTAGKQLMLRPCLELTYLVWIFDIKAKLLPHLKQGPVMCKGMSGYCRKCQYDLQVGAEEI